MTRSTHSLGAIRRVVTGHDPAGRAVVQSDGPAPTVRRPADGLTSTLMWVTGALPADIAAASEAPPGHQGTVPPEAGTRFGILDLAPGYQGALHRTDTVDYCICLAGEVELLLDEGSVVLNPGDVVIQRGTVHGWRNPGPRPARLAFVLLDGRPKRPGSLAAGQQAR